MPKVCASSPPSSSSAESRRATSTRCSPPAANCRANSLPIPDDAPVTTAQGPNVLVSMRLIAYSSDLSLDFSRERCMSSIDGILPDVRTGGPRDDERCRCLHPATQLACDPPGSRTSDEALLLSPSRASDAYDAQTVSL